MFENNFPQNEEIGSFHLQFSNNPVSLNQNQNQMVTPDMKEYENTFENFMQQGQPDIFNQQQQEQQNEYLCQPLQVQLNAQDAIFGNDFKNINQKQEESYQNYNIDSSGTHSSSKNVSDNSKKIQKKRTSQTTKYIKLDHNCRTCENCLKNGFKVQEQCYIYNEKLRQRKQITAAEQRKKKKNELLYLQEEIEQKDLEMDCQKLENEKLKQSLQDLQEQLETQNTHLIQYAYSSQQLLYNLEYGYDYDTEKCQILELNKLQKVKFQDKIEDNTQQLNFRQNQNFVNTSDSSGLEGSSDSDMYIYNRQSKQSRNYGMKMANYLAIVLVVLCCLNLGGFQNYNENTPPQRPNPKDILGNSNQNNKYQSQDQGTPENYENAPGEMNDKSGYYEPEPQPAGGYQDEEEGDMGTMSFQPQAEPGEPEGSFEDKSMPELEPVQRPDNDRTEDGNDQSAGKKESFVNKGDNDTVSTENKGDPVVDDSQSVKNINNNIDSNRLQQHSKQQNSGDDSYGSVLKSVDLYSLMVVGLVYMLLLL